MGEIADEPTGPRVPEGFETHEQWCLFLQSQNYRFLRWVPGWGWCALMTLIYTVGVVVRLDARGHGGRLCFRSWVEAESWLMSWDGRELPTVGQDGCVAIKLPEVWEDP